MFEGEKGFILFLVRILLWSKRMDQTLVFVKTEEPQNRKTCIVIRMNPDGGPLFHLKQ